MLCMEFTKHACDTATSDWRPSDPAEKAVRMPLAIESGDGVVSDRIPTAGTSRSIKIVVAVWTVGHLAIHLMTPFISDLVSRVAADALDAEQIVVIILTACRLLRKSFPGQVLCRNDSR